jgi:hypothetical protein
VLYKYTTRQKPRKREKKTYTFVNFKLKGRRPFGKPFIIWEINIKTGTFYSIKDSKFLD